MQVPFWQCSIDRAGDTSAVRLSGELDLAADREVREALTGELQRPDVTRMLTDMSEVTFIDSTVLSTLVYACNAAHKAGRPFVVSPSRWVRRLLEVTGLSYLLDPADG
ncbi:anti-sigma factor antagonist [Micromonospora sp. DR5-3]|uniref:anti-sigma factor antagonist n=1 Tax=unclassified Micromonospora TaxID=2617518 RepID=UPI0011DBE6B8|nr:MULTISPECIES: anti-sigma factor antagonist [unclassified Micromonospora]MCW3817726.1 anti-sigma factor antagonist [Micromonospora sp. DR5-3]TYC20035.1 anti-sigma factor antagonist [Micromonospora sp. MP36]